MKRAILRASTFIVVIVFGPLAFSLTTAQQAASTQTKSLSERTVVSPDFGSLSAATTAVNPLKIDPKQPSSKYMTHSAFLYEREKVEVLARSVTFPGVLNQGELMISVEFPNAPIFCLDAAYYAGRVEGLMLAMDRDTFEKHKLYRTIDAAGDLFDTCLKILILEAFADQNQHGEKIQIKDVREELADQILIIQEALRYARDVKIEAAALSAGGN